MIPALRLYYRFAFGNKEYGTFIDMPEGETPERYHEALDLLLESAEETLELLKTRADEGIRPYEKNE